MITGCWPHSFSVDATARDAAGPIPDLDHLVAWRRRDTMIAAAFGMSDDTVPRIVAPNQTACGRVGPPPDDGPGDAVPLWAVTISTSLLGHLTRTGVSPLDALRRICNQPRDSDDADTWIDLAGVRIHYTAGRLHGREFFDAHTVDDYYGVTLNLSDHSLPDTVMPAAVGRPLSDLVSFERSPALLTELDPTITEIETVGLRWTNAAQVGLLVHLDVHSLTVADIPASALAAIGKRRQHVLRSEKPWLAAG